MNQIITKPIVWTIAGSDSGGGAGIQADLQTIQCLGGHGCSVITAITAQNTKEVNAIEPVSSNLVSEQINSLLGDLVPGALKTGMLYSPEIIRLVAKKMQSLSSPLVLDPVMISTSGDALIDGNFIDVLVRDLIPQASIITPNLIETEKLTGIKFCSKNSEEFDLRIERAAKILIDLGAKSVLIKGGDRLESSQFSQDYFYDGKTSFWLTSNRIGSKSFHGTGCSLAAAIACSLAHGHSIRDALVIAKTYINQAIDSAACIGSGALNLIHSEFKPKQEYFPWITKTAVQGRERPQFLSCDEDLSLGFYPITDNVELLEKLVNLGVKTIQLRIKELPEADLETQIQKAVRITNNAKCRFFLNDYWRLAIKYKAYGVHLGQEDLLDADLKAIADSGLRIGISTHCHEEVARALAIRPSYIAIGPVFATTTKRMRFSPQGLEGFSYWRSVLNYPLVAIGGMFLENADQVLKVGADSIAVVRDIACTDNLNAKVKSWLDKF